MTTFGKLVKSHETTLDSENIMFSTGPVLKKQPPKSLLHEWVVLKHYNFSLEC